MHWIFEYIARRHDSVKWVTQQKENIDNIDIRIISIVSATKRTKKNRSVWKQYSIISRCNLKKAVGKRYNLS